MAVGPGGPAGAKMGSMNGRALNAGQDRGDGIEGGGSLVPTSAVAVKGIPPGRIPEQLKSIITVRVCCSARARRASGTTAEGMR